MPRLVLVERALARLGAIRGGVVRVPQGLSFGTFRIPRNGWQARPGHGKDAEVIECSIELSYDGGNTWEFFVGFGAPGGDLFDRRGDLLVESSVQLSLPQPEHPNRLVRATVSCKERLDIRLDLDAE